GADITGGSAPLGTVVHDTATVATQVGSFVISGTVTYTLYKESNGVNGLQTGGRPPDTQLGSPQTVTMSHGLVPPPAGQTRGPGPSYSPASYSGAATCTGASTAAPEVFTITQAPPTSDPPGRPTDPGADITGGSAPLGTVVHDTATVATQVGSFVISGTVTRSEERGVGKEYSQQWTGHQKRKNMRSAASVTRMNVPVIPA